MLYKQPVYRKTSFRVKKPIRSFRDLEVYQRTLEYSAEVMTNVVPLIPDQNCPIKGKIIECCLEIPESIAAAHSHRFETGREHEFLEKALEGCNKAVVYLEQSRDIYIKALEEQALCNDLIKRYILIRRKVFNLSKAWSKFGAKAYRPAGV